jgi:lysophospholipase L1-like esterase
MHAAKMQEPPGRPAPVARYTARQIAGVFVVLYGLAVLLSGAFLNPWVARIWKGTGVVDYAAVLRNFFAWAILLGSTAVVLGNILSRSEGPRWGRITLLFLVVASVVILDRFLLTRFNLPFWTHDPVVQYRNRPNRTWTLRGYGRPNDIVRINRYGFHDDGFPVAKPEGEFRALALGDSVTMGFGVTYPETYCGQLESLLGGSDRRFRSHQVINCGVHGYSTQQELQVLRESLRFGPDLIIIGFCMNDITEPFVVDRDLGGTGLDYHGVVQTRNAVIGFLVNETGFGRLFQAFLWRKKSVEAEKRAETYDVRQMAGKSDTEARFREGWAMVFKALEDIYAIGRQKGVPVVLVVFPFDFQLLDRRLQLPQRKLSEHAALHGVHVLDLTETFKGAVYGDEDLLTVFRSRGYSNDEIQLFYDWKLREYFFDHDHLTAKGHSLVAQALFVKFKELGLAVTR